MKKHTITGMALMLGILSAGAVSASAAGSCCVDGKCSDKPIVQQFTKETAELRSALKAKDIELRELAGYDTFDTRKQQALEDEMKELRSRISAVGQKYDIPPCCRS